MPKRIFITGATGFIGANLTKQLVLDGYKVVTLLRRHSYHPFLDNISIDRITGDITDKTSIEKGLGGCDYVFHCAAKISFNRYAYKDMYSVNVLGTRNILEAALKYGVKKFVHISASTVFGFSKDKRELIDENSGFKVLPNNIYAYTKKLAEDEVRKSCVKGLDAVIANPCTVYGQGDISLNSGSLIKAIYYNKLKFAPPGGTSVVSVDDLVNGLILMLNMARTGENYIFANGNIEYIKLFNKIAAVVGAKKVKHLLPRFFYYPAIEIAKTIEFINRDSKLITYQIIKELFGYKHFSSKKAEKELGWRPKVGIEESINNAFEFYKTYKLL